MSPRLPHSAGHGLQVGCWPAWSGRLLGVLLSLAVALPTAASGFRRLDVEQGLANDRVYAVTQDHAGFMWFGTEGGLNRYDGRRVVEYHYDPADPGGLAEGDVSFLLAAADGSLWVATWGGGLDRVEPASGHVTHFRDGFADGRVQTLAEAGDGRLWVGSYTAGLSLLDPRDGTVTQPAAAELRDVRVWSIARAGDGRVWVGTEHGLVALAVDSGAVELHRHDPGDPASLSHDIVRAVLVERSGRVWAGTEHGLCRRRADGGWERLAADGRPGSPRAEVVNCLREDSAGTIWVGSLKNGLDRFDPARDAFTNFHFDEDDASSLGDDDVRAIFEDRSRVLWLATRGGGLSLLDLKPAKFVHVDREPDDPASLVGRKVYCFAETADRRLWVGTARGLSVLDPAGKAFTHLVHDPAEPRSLGRADVIQLAVDGRDRVWASTWRGGVSLLEDEGRAWFRHFRAGHGERGPSADNVSALHVDRRGRLWLGLVGGVDRVDPESLRFEHFPLRSGGEVEMAGNFVWDLAEAADGALWVGTDSGGLFRLDPHSGRVESFARDADDPRSLPADRVFAVLVSASGVVWAGTSAGLARLDGAGFTRYSEADGLPDDRVVAILEDGAGRLWLSTGRGLARFDPGTAAVRVFTTRDGLQGSAFIPRAVLGGRDGRLYFGGSRGYNVFRPEEVVDNPYPPPLVLTGFRRFNQPLRCDRPLAELERIELGYRDNFFSFEFAALDYTAPADNQYRFVLEGLDPGWSEPTTRGVASYTDVKPGSYLFRARGANNDGVWSDQEIALRVVVVPPFWQTLWFRGLVLGAALAFGWAAYRLRVRAIRARNRELERLVGERTRALAAKRDQLERIDRIVAAINSQHDPRDLMTTILEQARVIPGVERAAALLLDPESGAFRFVATFGWELADLAEIRLTPAQAEARYVHTAEEIFPDIFVAKRVSERAAQDQFGGLEAPRSLLAMRIRLPDGAERRDASDGDQVGAYLVFDNMHDEEAFDVQDSQLLSALQGHVVSALRTAGMLAELRDLNEKKNELLGICAHDLRNPLGIISGWTKIVLRQLRADCLERDKVERNLERVVNVAEQMTGLVSTILDVSAIESGKLNLEISRQNLAEILEECDALYSAIAAEKEIALVVEPAPGVPAVMADRARVLEVIDNLVSNAVKYTFPGGRVRLFCEALASEVVVNVADTGQGLTEEDLKQVFKRFTKLSARPTGGEMSTGLGLAIVKKIVETHGGRIWVRSTKGEGTTFSFTLPVAAEAEGQAVC